MTHANYEKFIPAQQYGACHRKDVTTAIMYQKSIMDISRQANTDITVISNDAIGCYDHIVAILASMVCIKLGMELGPLLVLKNLLLNQKHFVCTAHETATRPYVSKPSDPLDGSCQGRGHSSTF